MPGGQQHAAVLCAPAPGRHGGPYGCRPRAATSHDVALCGPRRKHGLHRSCRPQRGGPKLSATLVDAHAASTSAPSRRATPRRGPRPTTSQRTSIRPALAAEASGGRVAACARAARGSSRQDRPSERRVIFFPSAIAARRGPAPPRRGGARTRAAWGAEARTSRGSGAAAAALWPPDAIFAGSPQPSQPI